MALSDPAGTNSSRRPKRNAADKARHGAEFFERSIRRMIAFAGRTSRRSRSYARNHRILSTVYLLIAVVLLLALFKAVPLVWNYYWLKHEVINVAEHAEGRFPEDLQAYLRRKARYLGYSSIENDPEAIKVNTFYGEGGDPHCEVLVEFRQTVNLYGIRSWSYPVKIKADRIVLPRPSLPQTPDNLWELPQR